MEEEKVKIVKTCNECEDYGVCPHSYKEYDLEQDLTMQVGKLLKIKEYCINLKSAKHFDKMAALDYILKIIREDDEK